MDWGRWVGVATLVLLAASFSFFNSGERVTLHLGFTTVYRLSLVGVVFAAFLLGMVAMFLFSLRHDRRVRSALRSQYHRPPSVHASPPRPPDPPD